MMTALQRGANTVERTSALDSKRTKSFLHGFYITGCGIVPGKQLELFRVLESAWTDVACKW
jgi:hypothetical protein